jgi:hypothetical protein
MTEIDLDAVQRVARATCAQMHKSALESGYLVRPRKDPGQYRSRLVWPVVFAAFAGGIILEAKP